MPFGAYDYVSARRAARRCGHIALPGYLPRRYEVVVGLTEKLARGIVDECRGLLGRRLAGLFVCGSRVVTRPRLKTLDPWTFERPSGLKVGHKDRVREFGKSVGRSSDLDLKVFVDEDDVSTEEAEDLALELGAQLEPLASFPLSGHRRPLHRVLRTPRGNARSRFEHYNEARWETMNKVALSYEYVQVLFDPEDPAQLDRAAEAEVAAFLEAKRVGPRLTTRPARDDAWVRTTWRGLTGHQWSGALMDFPELDVPAAAEDAPELGVILAAAFEAGRKSVPLSR